jgi:integrase
VLLLLTIQTGLRVSELIGFRCKDIVLDSGAHVRCKGKGRKDPCTNLRKELVVFFHLIQGSLFLIQLLIVFLNNATTYPQ